MELSELGRRLAVPDLDHRLALVERRIDDAMDVDLEAYRGAMRRVAAAGGKRLRPALTIACAELHGARGDEVTELAAAVELVQIGSLIHDDIIDEAETRRGIPTLNSVEGGEVAIVAGDLVLARAGELASAVSSATGVVVNSTIARLCIGQFDEMADLHDPGRTLERHLRSVDGKTAALFASACRLGAMAAGVPPEREAALGAFGHGFGMAFQLLDDLLDVVGDAGRLGKPVGVDIAAGVYTVPVLHALAGPRHDELVGLLREDADAARSVVIEAGGVDASRRAIAEHTARATAALDDSSHAGDEVLRAFPAAYVEWAFEAFTDASHR